MKSTNQSAVSQSSRPMRVLHSVSYLLDSKFPSRHLHVSHVGVTSENISLRTLKIFRKYSSPGAVGEEDQVCVFPARVRHLEDALAVGLPALPVGGAHQVFVTSTDVFNIDKIDLHLKISEKNGVSVRLSQQSSNPPPH